MHQKKIILVIFIKGSGDPFFDKRPKKPITNFKVLGIKNISGILYLIKYFALKNLIE